MPLLLTTAYDPGDNDPGQTYPRAKVVAFDWQDDRITFRLEVGDEVGDPAVWTFGPGADAKQFILTGADYDAVVAEASLASELIYVGVKRVLYQWLIDNGHVAGTIE